MEWLEPDGTVRRPCSQTFTVKGYRFECLGERGDPVHFRRPRPAGHPRPRRKVAGWDQLAVAARRLDEAVGR